MSSEARPPFVVLGVSAGIAAYKAIEVCRRLVDAGVHVAPVLTEATLHFVGRTTFDALGSERAQVSIWDEDAPIAHTRLGQEADLIVVAPATADLLARYAAGMANDLLTTTLVATRAPVIVCPAMHTEMWEHPAVQANVATLRARGVEVIEPTNGRLAGGDVGAGRLAEPEVIVATVLDRLAGSDPALAGRRVLVSAGGTREAIDPVRFISNRSSGKQGHAVAEEARRCGATVTLVTTQPGRAPLGVEVVAVETAAEMESAMLAHAPSADVVVMAAAVADFRPVETAAGKLHKADGLPELTLVATNDILAALGQARPDGQILVGFAAETDDLQARAAEKMVRKGVQLMVANDVSAPGVGFDHDTNEVLLLGADGAVEQVSLTSKRAVACAILARVASLMEDPSSSSSR